MFGGTAMETEAINKLTDAELKIMEVLWKEGDCTAKHVAEVMTERSGWNRCNGYKHAKGKYIASFTLLRIKKCSHINI